MPFEPFRPRSSLRLLPSLLVAIMVAPAVSGLATPANRAALGAHYDRFLSRKLNACSTCHLPSERENPLSLDEFPHNPFGDQLRRLGTEDSNAAAAGQHRDLATRLAAVAALDADGDGVANESEILLGHNPGNAKDAPTAAELEVLPERRAEFARLLTSYRWHPFNTVRRPSTPAVSNPRWVLNPIDAFVAAAREERSLRPRPEARREVLLRRVYLDLIGLLPTPEEQRAFLADTAPDAYERVVDRLLADPRHGERWGRHWMDVWRYSDWAGWADGNQIRDSKPHIWRWRDWIVESLNADRGYDRMVMEMLAADELAPLDTNALRATGFLVRNYKMLSREQWLEDTIKHTSMAFLGVTAGCAKCHDHMTDPISQADYYRMRAIFEPHHVRTDRLPGELDTAKDGLVRAFDTGSNRVTHFLIRGDERHPDTNRIMLAGIPPALCGDTPPARTKGALELAAIGLPREAARPDEREFVRRELLDAAERAVRDANIAAVRAATNGAASPQQRRELELTARLAEAKLTSLQAVLNVEALEIIGRKGEHAWTIAAMDAMASQRSLAVHEARLKLQLAAGTLAAAQSKLESLPSTNQPATSGTNLAAIKPAEREKATQAFTAAQKKRDEAAAALSAAKKAAEAPATTAYQRRTTESYPEQSTGRRLAFARWIADPANPLTARVAMNHLWLRHFGRGLVPTPTDFGRGGRPPSHPALLDWLAAEFMERGWSMKQMHRLMVTSRTYQMASTQDENSIRLDPDNVWLWRMPTRRLEAEAIRDNLLYVAGDLDPAMGGPDIDHREGLTSKRRSLYLRLAAEKEVEFLRLFDGPTVTECYQRRPSVIPQQALALGNSEIAFRQAERIAAQLTKESRSDDEFVQRAYQRVLARRAKAAELTLCREFLTQPPSRPAVPDDQSVNQKAAATGVSRERQRANLLLVLLNHSDFVTVR